MPNSGQPANHLEGIHIFNLAACYMPRLLILLHFIIEIFGAEWKLWSLACYFHTLFIPSAFTEAMETEHHMMNFSSIAFTPPTFVSEYVNSQLPIHNTS
jgi:hypothetical protein